MGLTKAIFCAVCLSGIAVAAGSTDALAEPGSAASYTETTFQSGKASWYGPGFHGRRTASGERFNTNDLTAAHKTLPFGTKVKVTNARTGRSVVVRINDRGPYAGGRVIDLSRSAAQAVSMVSSGTAPVSLEVLR